MKKDTKKANQDKAKAIVVDEDLKAEVVTTDALIEETKKKTVVQRIVAAKRRHDEKDAEFKEKKPGLWKLKEFGKGALLVVAGVGAGYKLGSKTNAEHQYDEDANEDVVETEDFSTCDEDFDDCSEDTCVEDVTE